MQRYKSFIGKKSVIEREIVTWMLAFMVVINFFEIIRRLIVGNSFLWVQEVSVILICWLVFIGASHVYASPTPLLNVDFLYSKSRGIVRFIWYTLIQVISLCVLVIFFYYGILYSIQIWAPRTNALHIPFTAYSLPLVLASASMMLTMVANIWDAWQEYKNPDAVVRQEGGGLEI